MQSCNLEIFSLYTVAVTIRELSDLKDLRAYDLWVRQHVDGSLWQSPEWKEFQEKRGRTVRIFTMEDDRILLSALVVIDRTSMGLCTWDIPRGPLVHNSGVHARDAEQFLMHMENQAKRDGCYALYFSPCHAFESIVGWKNKKLSPRHEQPEATIVVDLRLSEEEILAQMHQKGRYNIRLAQRNGVTVDQSAHVGAFYALVKETAQRDGFTPLPEEQYRLFLRTVPDSFLLLAYAPGEEKPIAGLIGVMWNGRGIYYYGASSHGHRSLMAPSLLQWEAMRFCKTRGCTTYDLFGIAPPDGQDHHLGGVTDFKRKLGGSVVTYPPEHRLVLRPFAAAVLTMKRRMWR